MSPPLNRPQAPFPSLTQLWHSEPYPSISPLRPSLAIPPETTVVITGGGGAIGSAEALAFAQAGCTKIALLGRRPQPLLHAQKLVESSVPGTRVLVLPDTDIADATSTTEAMRTVERELGKVDVLCANAGYLSKFAPITEADADDWWTGYEINAKGAFNLARALVPVASEEVVVVETSTCVVHLPAMHSASSYVTSKLAGTKIWEMVARENEGVEVIHMHPGVVVSELNVKSGVTATDSPHLAGQFAVWAVSPEAKNFRGKYLWCNWDVPELLRREKELTQRHQLTITLNEWPFGMTPETMDPLAFKG